MRQHANNNTARDIAVARARRIFYRPAAVVDRILAEFAALPPAQYPGRGGIVLACYQRPVRMGATLDVFGLRAFHWPMLNLLDRAEADRRAFAEAMADAIEHARA